MGTLAVVEHPGTENQSDSSEDQDRDTVPITSSVYATMKHLYASAGRWFWLRGAFYFLVYKAIDEFGLRSYIPDLQDRSMFVQWPAYFLYSAVIANWQTTWVHAVISQPSTQSFLERILRYRFSGVALSAIAMQVTLTIPAFDYCVRVQSRVINYFDIEPDFRSDYQSFAVVFLPTAVERFISLLAQIMFLRLAASTLPQDEQSIIRLDPSLGSEDEQSVVDGWNIGHGWKILFGPSMARAWGIFGRQFAISMGITMLGMMIDPTFYHVVGFPLVWFPY